VQDLIATGVYKLNLDIIFKLIKFIEHVGCYFQGKGYGTNTLEQEFKLLHSFVKDKPKLVIDIGGNIGDYSEIIRSYYPLAEIHIFEPSSKNISFLKSRFSQHESINVVPAGVSNVSGSGLLYSDKPGSAGSSLTKRRLEHFDRPFDVVEKVTTIRFADYWENELKRRPIDLVKIDVEGHELDVLQGFGQALTAVKALQFEFGGCNIDTHTYFQDFWYFFKDHNFDIYRITPLGVQRIAVYSESDEFFRTTNFIAVNQN
jgi:FkbM family methyltransferase